MDRIESDRPLRTLPTRRLARTATAAAALVALLGSSLIAGTALAQGENWGESPSDPPATRPAASGQGSGRGLDGRPVRGYNEFTGFYGQFGVSVGEIELDGNADVDAGGGFTMTGGYRLLSWLALEGNISYLGGGELDGTNREVDFFSITFGPKFYPLGALREQPMLQLVQPYALVGIGGGEYDIEDTGYEESTFIARFIAGFDVWLTDHAGVFVEGGYHVAADDDIDGTGLFTVGGQYRF